MDRRTWSRDTFAPRCGEKRRKDGLSAEMMKARRLARISCQLEGRGGKRKEKRKTISREALNASKRFIETGGKFISTRLNAHFIAVGRKPTALCSNERPAIVAAIDSFVENIGLATK